MAEQAAGAVSSLLSIIRNEAQLLGGVGDDVRSIREEMESMNSFLEFLARTAPPGGEHDEQVNTWMNQVRSLALDCNKCLDIYLYRRNPDFLLARGRFERYLCWLPWFLSKTVAQHRAAGQLKSLKARAREVGERQSRYNVRVPEKGTSSTQGSGHNSDDQLLMEVTEAAGGHSGDGRAFFMPPPPLTLEEYLEAKLVHWITTIAHQQQPPKITKGMKIPSVSIIVPPDAHHGTSAIAHEALAVARAEAEENQSKLTVLLVDISSMHLEFMPLRPKEILFYILREMNEFGRAERQSQAKQQQQGEGNGYYQGDNAHDQQYIERRRKWDIYFEKKQVMEGVKRNIRAMKLNEKIEELKKEFEGAKSDRLLLRSLKKEMKDYDKKKLKGRLSEKTLGVLLLLLQSAASTADEQDQAIKNQDMPTLALWYDDIIKETTKKLQELMEKKEGSDDNTDADDDDDSEEDDDDESEEDDDDDSEANVIHLDPQQYANILWEVFPKTINSKHQQDQQHDQDNTTITTPTLGEDQIKQIVEKVKLEILQELLLAGTRNYSKSPQAQEEYSLATLEATKPTATIQGEGSSNTRIHEKNLDSIVHETKLKMEEVKQNIYKQLKIKRIMDAIKNLLNNRSVMIILKTYDPMTHDFPWNGTRNALNLLDSIAGVVIVTTPSHTQQEYCYPQEQEPINYSLVGLYKDHALKLTSQKKHEKIICSILEICKAHEFCMKIFVHALYANPKRHSEELDKLHRTLQKVSPNSPASIAKEMFNFSYNDLPKEYKFCLLYLAIFPPEYKIRRSTLIGRWVAEGLITTEDWLWSSSVCKAEKCFDALIRRLLVYPGDIGAAGEVKSCMVTNTIHGFITNIAEKQRIIEARLSHHLAHHFSIYNDLRLLGSDTIIDFFKKLSKSSPLLKVLDVQGCQCFGGKNIWFLKQICSKILLLKYLSIRGTNAAQLPTEINNLQELEVLDIRQTKVSAKATRHIRLLKLKRLLAGNTDPSLSSTDIASVQVPEKVENMEHMEVLSNVKPLSSQDLKDIGTLFELRKLGLVIEDKDSHLRELFNLISNLHRYLRSLSITLHSTTKREGSPYSRGYSCLLNATNRRLSSTKTEYDTLMKDPPKLLESLNISGTTQNVQLLQELLTNGVKELVKVTLSNTSLKQDDMEVLGKLPKLRCFRLRDISCTNTKLTFNEVEFPRLKYFTFEGSSTTNINFQVEETHGLEEIVLSFNIDGLPNMEHELEEHKSNNTTTNTIAATTTGVSGLPTQEQNESKTTTSTTDSTTTTTTEVNVLPKLEQESNKNDTATVAATTTDDATATTDATTTKVIVLPKLEQESNNNDTATATATTTTVVDSLPKLEEQKSNNNTTTINTTTGVDSLPKQEEHDLHPITTTRNSMLLSLFDNNAKQIAKVTLRGTLLKEDTLRKLAKKPKLRCLVLLEKSYDEINLTFNEDDFPKLSILIINCSNINKINFTRRSAPKLEKINWTFAKDKTDYSLSGINNLPKLKDFEFYGDVVPHQVQEELNKHRNKPALKKNKPENQEQEIGNTPEEKGITCFPFCMNNKV